MEVLQIQKNISYNNSIYLVHRALKMYGHNFCSIKSVSCQYLLLQIANK